MSDPGRTASGGSGEGTATPQHSDGARLMAACGEHIDLVVDAWFDDYNTREDQLLNLLMASRQANAKALFDSPLERELLITHANCLCSLLNSVKVTNRFVSGSYADGLNGLLEPQTCLSTSDLDSMYELGPVDWVFPDAPNSSSFDDIVCYEATRDANIGGPTSDPPSRLVITETENPGFVLLLQERRDDCPHQERLVFNAEDVKKVFKDLRELGLGPNKTAIGVRGPAIFRSNNAAAPFEVVEYEDVACLHVAVWFIPDEFFTRHRQHNWPPEAVRENMRGFGLHLVPVGAPGSSTERFEFRISFSRAELILASLLTDRQRHAVIAFKVCKAVVRNGKTIKSYYAKTALLWLCEQTPKDDWTTVSQSVIKLLDFLEEAVDTGNLPCYFWSQMNLLRFTSWGEREVMKRALHDMKRNLVSLLARELCAYRPDLQEILTQTTTHLTERQVRACLARWSIAMGIKAAFFSHLRLSTRRVVDLVSAMVHSQQLTSSAVAKMLVPFSRRHRLQIRLYKALTVAPVDVTLQTHLTSMGHGFVWDAAPLLGLLTEDDLRDILGDPEAVRAWLRRQHQLPETERPAGLPADLRSPRDLCDLLFNSPLLSRALRESVLDFWKDHERFSTNLMKKHSENEFVSYEACHENLLSLALKWKDLACNFQTKLGMDRQTALRTACRAGVEMRRLLDDPETAREFERRKRRVPDPWGVLPFLLRRPL